MVAGQFFTLADSENGYVKTRAALETYTEKELEREYHEYLKASFDRMFGHNAKKYFNLVTQELLRRGITELPNIFGSIAVKELN